MAGSDHRAASFGGAGTSGVGGIGACGQCFSTRLSGEKWRNDPASNHRGAGSSDRSGRRRGLRGGTTLGAPVPSGTRCKRWPWALHRASDLGSCADPQFPSRRDKRGGRISTAGRARWPTRACRRVGSAMPGSVRSCAPEIARYPGRATDLLTVSTARCSGIPAPG